MACCKKYRNPFFEAFCGLLASELQNGQGHGNLSIPVPFAFRRGLVLRPGHAASSATHIPA